MTSNKSLIKKIVLILTTAVTGFMLIFLSSCQAHKGSWIRINQVGYLPQSSKVAVFVSKEVEDLSSFSLVDKNDNIVFTSDEIRKMGDWGPFESTFRLDFSSFSNPGTYFLKSGSTISPPIEISNAIYADAADFLLKYMRQQRCGYNPYLQDSCHTQDGYTMYGPMPDSTHVDVTGGWHDATDYLQYSTTSANAVFNMLLAFRDYPNAFSDSYLANGLPGTNNKPDILDEAIWGLEWLEKMYPEPQIMYNQIADDRDHVGYRLPNLDSADYGKGLERPVYFASGEVQGLFGNTNKTTGVASIAGKFASSFALAALVEADPAKQDLYRHKAISAFRFGQSKPGNHQTAPGRSPYYYEEETWLDDMELAAATLWQLTGIDSLKILGNDFAKQQPIVPWMGSDTATHYQFYPFVNIGHHMLDGSDSSSLTSSFYKQAIDRVKDRGKDSPFRNGIPFIWCSNNLTAAFLTQCLLYRKMTGDNSYLEMENAMLDWLLGCNPWGTSMIVGYPATGDTPIDPHSSLNHLYGYQTDGGLIDGPVYGSIYNNLKGLVLHEEDEYAQFQSDIVVYHDDVGDYSTNEPTMDGTASLMYYFAYLASLSK